MGRKQTFFAVDWKWTLQTDLPGNRAQISVVPPVNSARFSTFNNTQDCLVRGAVLGELVSVCGSLLHGKIQGNLADTDRPADSDTANSWISLLYIEEFPTQ